MADALIKQAQSSAEVQTVLANGLVRSNDSLASVHSRLIDTLPAIADATRNGGRALVAPIGNTCREIKQLSDSPRQIVSIDEADAAVIRSYEQLEVDDMSTFKCLSITEVNRGTGHCILDVEGFDSPVIGKISDPSLQTPNNVYTKSLNEQTPFQFSAKPVKRDGAIKTLYISDAQEIT